MEFFLRFQAANPRVIIGKRMFDSFQPFFVKKLKERNVCCCIYQVEIKELRIGFNYMRSNCGMHDQIACECGSYSPCSCDRRPGCGCHCEEVCLVEDSDHCGAHLTTFPGVTAMAESILCPIKDDSGWVKAHYTPCTFCQKKSTKKY
jgi:hypothetical protein